MNRATELVLKQLTSLDESILPRDQKKRNIVWAILLGSSSFSLAVIWKLLDRRYRREKREEIITTTKQAKKPRYAVDALFLRRLGKILKIVVPGVKSREFLHLIVLTALLLARTILSVKVADVTGQNAQYLVERRWADTVKGILMFAAIGIPASIVNSGLKYETAMLSLNFRKRLSSTVNAEYLSGVNFYKAAQLGGENKIDNADQRVTTDIEKFCDSLSNLYATIFKPVLDVILFTYKLTGLVGFSGPMLLFGYYALCGVLKRYFMPAFGKLTARESELEGDYRTAHQRLISNAEEIAFYDGSKKERHIINRLFNEIYLHSRYVQWLKACVGVFDNFLIKYGTSITGYIILALPIYFHTGKQSTQPDGQPQSVAALTNAYVRNRQLLISLGTAIAQLVVLSNKVTSLSGLTARVAELLEMVRKLDKMGSQPFTIRHEPEENPEEYMYDPYFDATKWIEEWRTKGERIRVQRESLRPTIYKTKPVSSTDEGGQIIEGKFIKFENVSIVSPDGKLLVENLNFQVKLHQNVMVTGPNGSGKSSLFRILGELWPLYNGILVKPRKEELLFVPQKPYLVLGTLRDQIIYPHSLEDMKNLNISDDDLARLLDIVDPARTILNTWNWDDVKDWFSALSGGQKQRVAMARLFYHRPLFAILDECTSAVSDEVEGKIYETCKALGITLFTVSHRPQLKRYHDYILRFDGRGKWEFYSVDHSDEARLEDKEQHHGEASDEEAIANTSHN